jgi:hypothetical protein
MTIYPFYESNTKQLFISISLQLYKLFYTGVKLGLKLREHIKLAVLGTTVLKKKS